MCGVAEAGLALSLFGAVSSAGAAKDEAKFKSNQLSTNAALNRVESAVQADDAKRKKLQILGEQKAQYGASNINLNGSPRVAIAENAGELARHEFDYQFNSDINHQSLLGSAENATTTGNNRAMAEIWNAGSAVTAYAK